MHHTTPTLDRSGASPFQFAGRIYRATTALTIFAMLFGGILLLTAPSAAARSGSPTTTAWVNLRTGPSTSDEVILVVPDGTSIDVTGDPDNGFYPVNANGTSGYVSADFISLDGEMPESDSGSEDTEESGTDDGGESGGGGTTNTGNAGATLYVVDGALNLRAGPGTDTGIITVMPGGAAVTTTGESSSGFLGVTYNGSNGWAFADFLSSNGGGDDGVVDEEEAPEEDTSADGSVPVGESVTGSAVVADGPLNLRAGPSTSTSILNVMPTGSSIELMGEIQSGFHPVRYQGQTGWAFAEFVGVGGTTPAPDEEEVPEDSDGAVPVPGDDVIGTAMVIAGALNLRSGPSTSTAVQLVMADGSQVSLLGDPQNGFYPVSFDGNTGWAFGEYLSVGGNNDPDPVPDDGSEEEPAPDPGDSGDVGNGDTNGDGSYSRDELVAIIEVAAARYGQPVNDMIRVAGCESVWDPRAVNSSSGASGLFQFMPGTWLTTPFADQDIFDPIANANAAAWMWSVGRRNEWSCQ